MTEARGRTFLGRDITTLTVSDVLREQAASFGSKMYLRALDNAREYSFAEVESLTNSWARGLVAAGVERGAHVGVMMANSDELLFLYLALGKVGAVGVPLNPEETADRQRYFLELCDVEILIGDAAFIGAIAATIDDIPAISLVIARNGQGTAFASSRVPVKDFDEIRDWPDDRFDNGVKFTDTAFLALTSGTTGPSKAVPFSQATMFMIALSYATSYGYNSDDVYYICLPLFHTSSLRGGAYVALLTGGAVALRDGFSVRRFWADIRDSGATTFDLLGSMTDFLWQAPESEAERQHKARFCRVAPVPAFGQAFEQRFGLRIVSTYGLTDGGAPIAYDLDDPAGKFGSCGKLREGWQLRIVDENDFELPRGSLGEIVIRSDVPWLMPYGYYKMPQESFAAWRNGWFHTGDRGHMDPDGYLYFVDRMKDVIRRRGKNISAFEVENAIRAHPLLREVAVYPVSSEFSEDEVALSVVRQAGAALDEAALRQFCAEKLPSFAVPQHIEFLDAMPLTPSKKINKGALRARVEGDARAQVAPRQK